MRKLLVFTGILLAIFFGLKFSAIHVDSKVLESPRDIGENISLPLIQSGFDPGNQVPTATIEPTQTPEPTSDTSELIPIDNGTGTYKGLPLQLANNSRPAITPVDGIIGVVCVGMSNAFIECRDYIEKWLAGNFDGEVNPQLRFINCAKPSRAIEHWNDPQFDDELWGDCTDNIIPDLGYEASQVRVIWHKAAKMNVFQDGSLPPLYPDMDSDYYNFYEDLTTFAGRIPDKFPSVEAVYTTSRSFGGFSVLPERGEPYAYEEGHALNSWLDDHPMVEGVWYGWGPYFWSPDCSTGIVNGSGVCYIHEDYENDGIHPDIGALSKMTPMLHNRFRLFEWYR